MTQYARDMDYEYALYLQKQFEAEFKSSKKVNESQTNMIVPHHNKDGKINLADPHLELIDPTPNIHALFIQFDANFFWKRLGGVAIRWSKRMYSCAGICRYDGRGGMCDIALSEPLLRLRPRKDLIETLLHEMIHAYLFLTNNDRDRDGHGPKFHEHMYRINKAANINITVYHSFIDEVHLYQTHWWRCNGPCQKWKPYFGIVRRSANRAPGPNDFWWKNHQQKCGGMFIKIKEPEKKTSNKKGSKKENTNPKRLYDLTKFIQLNNPGPSKVVTLKDCTSNSPNDCGSVNTSFKSNNNKIEQIKIKTDKVAIQAKPTECSNKTLKGIVRDHWATKYPESLSQDKNTVIDYRTNKNPELSKGHKKPAKPTERGNKTLKGVVRDHWANKYPEPSKYSNNVKKNRLSESDATKPSSKKPKVDSKINNSITNCMPTFGTPKKKKCEQILKDIYGDDFNVDKTLFKKHDKPNDELPNITLFEPSLSLNVNCPSCSKSIAEDAINDHLDLCILSEFESIPNTQSQVNKRICVSSANESNSSSEIGETSQCKPKHEYSETFIQKHSPILHIHNEDETDVIKKNDISDNFICPVCNKQFPKHLNNHLEDCVSNFFKGETDYIPESSIDETISLVFDDDLDESQEFNETGTKFPCPCCLGMIEQEIMNEHLDDCLGK